MGIIEILYLYCKNRSAEYEKTAGINLCAVIKYFEIKKKTETIVIHGNYGKFRVKSIRSLAGTGVCKLPSTWC